MMKPKDAGFFSLHIEKIILLIALLICALLAMMYVVSSPNKIKMNNKLVDAGKAAKMVEAESQRLRSGLNAEPEIPEVHTPDYSSEFNSRLNETTVAVASSYLPLGNPGTDKNLFTQDNKIPLYYLPTPPMPNALAVRIGNAVLDKIDDDTMEEIVNVTYTGNPENFRYASIKAEFPIDVWSERLAAKDVSDELLQYNAVVKDDEGNPILDAEGNVVTEVRKMQPVPEGWWRRMLAVTSVMLEREELDPITGEWGNRQFVSNMPTQIAYRPDNSRFDGSTPMPKIEAQRIVQDVKARQMDICRPEFLPMAFPLNWVPPDAKKLTPEEEKELYKIRKNIARYEKQLTKIQENLEKMRKRDEMEKTRRDASGSRSRGTTSRSRSPRSTGGAGMMGAMGGEMGMEGGGGRTSRSGRSARTRSTGRTDQGSLLQEQMMQIQERLIKEIEEREVLLGRREEFDPNAEDNNMNMGMYGRGGGMQDMMMGEMDNMMMGGMGPGGMMGGNPMGMGMRPGSISRRLSQVVETQYEMKEDGTRVMKVWAHDITIQPGKTYRYRVIVSVLNPLFSQHRVSADQKAANNYKLALIPSEEERVAGEWTEAVTPDPQSYFFLVGNSASSARVEVWALNRGKWLRKEFTFEPGDEIGGIIEDDSDGRDKIEIPVSSGAVMVDMIAASKGRNAQLLYVDPESNAISYRDANSDKDSPTRIRIQNEAVSFDELIIERDRDTTSNSRGQMMPNMMNDQMMGF
ncbi:hypothetical protein JD969_18545 [Planctomycetota bacterium]|nr:hypothetical protein JD969_18545 [Planctomycetota bacterium]